MKVRTKNLLIVLLMAIACAFSVLAISSFTAKADSPNYVDFSIKKESNAIFINGDTGFQRVNLKPSDNTPTVIPELVRTDSLDYEFDGWYYGNEKVSLSTVFDGYAVMVDKWNEVTYDQNKIVSSLSLNPALPTAGMNKDTYKTACEEVSKTGVWVNENENFILYNGLNAVSGNELTGEVQEGKNYSAKITLRVDYANGYRIGKDFMSNVTTANGLISSVSFVGSNGAVIDYWTTDVRMVIVVFNFPYNDFVSYPSSKYVENGKEVIINFETTFLFSKAILQLKTGFSTWSDLYLLNSGVKGKFTLPALVDTTETFRIYIAFPDGQVKVGEDFTIVYGSGTSNGEGKFIVQPPVTVDLALNEDYIVQYMFNRSFSNMWLDVWKGYWAERVVFHDNGVTTISGYDHATSNTYRIAISYEYNGEYCVEYSDNFTINWIDNATSWTVSFDANTGLGTMADVENVSGEFTLPTPEFTAPNGKEFEQWLSDGVRYNVGDKVDITRAKLFIALWKPLVKDSYDITFNANGGSGDMGLVLAKYEEEYTLPSNKFTAPSGKKFDSWWINGKTYQVGDTVVIKSDTELVANWVDETYSVTFNANGGDGEMSSDSEALSNYTLPYCSFSAPSGKQFVGWAVNDVNATPVGEGNKVKLTENSTLYAIWADNDPYFIIYDSGKGNGETISFSMPEGSNFTVATFESLGFTAPCGKVFSHWKEKWTNTDNVSEGSNYTVPADDTYFTAVFVSTGETVYTIQFNANGQSGEMESVEVVEGTEYTLPKPEYTAPSGTKFVGWSIGGDITNIKKPFEKIIITGTTDLDAVWRTPQEIKADYEGRVIVGEKLNVSNVIINLVYDDGYEEPILPSSVQFSLNQTPIAVIEDYIFNELGSILLNVKFETYESVEMGVMVVSQYKVSFDGNGAKGDIEMQLVYSSNYTLPENKFIAPKNKVFKCWLVNSNEYAPNQTIALTGDTVVTAVWENTYTISFNANGGDGEMFSIFINANTYTLPQCVFTAPNGKQFKGWSTSIDGEIVGNSVTINGNVEFFAIWEDVESDTPNGDNGGLPTGAIVGIAVGGAVVASVGGFAIFWFVIKKKSFNELLAIFKKK